MQHFTDGTPGKRANYFLSQPHQPFFLFGILWAVVLMVLFGLGFKGVLALHLPLLTFHAYGLIFIVFSQFFTGFLFTTFPRFCQSEPVSQTAYLRIFALFQAGGLLFVLGTFFSTAILSGGIVLLLAANSLLVVQLQRVYNTGRMSRNNSDPFWILTGFYFGLAAHLLFAAEMLGTLFALALPLYAFAAQLGLLHYLIFVAFAVAQRMVPFFSHSMVEKRPYFTATVFALLLVKSSAALLAYNWLEIVVDIALALFLLREFLRWKLPLFSSPAILWVLHLALFWLPAGLLMGALAGLVTQLGGSPAPLLQVHLLSLGFVTTILIGFGTRVTLGHSGQPPHADRFAVALFWLTQAVVLARALYSMQSEWLWLFDLSFTLWVILFVLWALRYGPVLTRAKKL